MVCGLPGSPSDHVHLAHRSCSLKQADGALPRSMTRERRFRFRTSAKPGRGPTTPATPARLAGAAAAAGWSPIPRHRIPACRGREVRQRHDATPTLPRGEPIGKHVKRLTVLVKNGCDKRHTTPDSAPSLSKARHSLDDREATRAPSPTREAGDEQGLTGFRCSYRVYVQSRGAGRSGLPTGNGNRWLANRGVRRSSEPQTGPDSKATSVAGRRCG